MIDVFKRALELRRDFPESVFTVLMQFEIIPVLEFKGEINSDTRPTEANLSQPG